MGLLQEEHPEERQPRAELQASGEERREEAEEGGEVEPKGEGRRRTQELRNEVFHEEERNGAGD